MKGEDDIHSLYVTVARYLLEKEIDIACIACKLQSTESLTSCERCDRRIVGPTSCSRVAVDLIVKVGRQSADSRIVIVEKDIGIEIGGEVISP